MIINSSSNYSPNYYEYYSDTKDRVYKFDKPPMKHRLKINSLISIPIPNGNSNMTYIASGGLCKTVHIYDENFLTVKRLNDNKKEVTVIKYFLHMGVDLLATGNKEGVVNFYGVGKFYKKFSLYVKGDVTCLEYIGGEENRDFNGNSNSNKNDSIDSISNRNVFVIGSDEKIHFFDFDKRREITSTYNNGGGGLKGGVKMILYLNLFRLLAVITNSNPEEIQLLHNEGFVLSSLKSHSESIQGIISIPLTGKSNSNFEPALISYTMNRELIVWKGNNNTNSNAKTNHSVLEIYKNFVNFGFDSLFLNCVIYLYSSLIAVGFQSETVYSDRIIIADFRTGIVTRIYENKYCTLNSIIYIHRENDMDNDGNPCLPVKSSFFAVTNEFPEILIIDVDTSDHITTSNLRLTSYMEDNNNLFIGFQNGEIQIWRIFGKEKNSNIHSINSIKSNSNSNSINFFDLVCSLKGHKNEVTGMKKLRSNNNNCAEYLIISASKDTTMKVWDVINKVCVEVYYGFDSGAYQDLQFFQYKEENDWYSTSVCHTYEGRCKAKWQLIIQNTQENWKLMTNEQGNNKNKSTSNDEVTRITSFTHVPRSDTVYKTLLLISGNSLGFISIYKMIPKLSDELNEYLSFSAHEGSITALCYIYNTEDNTPILISSGIDGFINLYNLNEIEINCRKLKCLFTYKAVNVELKCLITSEVQTPLIIYGDKEGGVGVLTLVDKNYSLEVRKYLYLPNYHKSSVNCLLQVIPEEENMTTPLLISGGEDSHLIISFISSDFKFTPTIVNNFNSPIKCITYIPTKDNNMFKHKDKYNPIIITGSIDCNIHFWSIDTITENKLSLNLVFRQSTSNPIANMQFIPHYHLLNKTQLLIYSDINGSIKAIRLNNSLNGEITLQNTRNKNILYNTPILFTNSFTNSPILISIDPNNSQIKFYNLNLMHSEIVLNHKSEVSSFIYISAEENILNTPIVVSVGGDNLVRVFELVTGNVVDYLQGQLNDATCMGFMKRPGRLFNNSPVFLTGGKQKEILIWELFSQSQSESSFSSEWKLTDTENVDLTCCFEVVYMMDSESDLLASGHKGGQILLWDLDYQDYFWGQSPKLLAKFCSGDGNIRSLCHILPIENNLNLSLLISGSDWKWLIIWDLTRVKADKLVNFVVAIEAHTNSISCILKTTITNDSVAITAGGDGLIKLWDLHSINTDLNAIKCVNTLKGHIGSVLSLCLIPANATIHNIPLLASGGEDKTVKLWNLQEYLVNTPKYILSFTHHTNTITSLVYIPQGDSINNSLLATASLDGKIKLKSLNKLICESSLFSLEDHTHSNIIHFHSSNSIGAIFEGNIFKLIEIRSMKIKFYLENTHFLQSINNNLGEDNNFLIIGNSNQELSVYREDLEKVKEIKTGLKECIVLVKSMIINGEIKLGIGSVDGTVLILNYSDTNNNNDGVIFTNHNYSVHIIEGIQFGVRTIFLSGDCDGVVKFFNSEGKQTHTTGLSEKDDELITFSLVRNVGRYYYLLILTDKSIKIQTIASYSCIDQGIKNFIVQEMNY